MTFHDELVRARDQVEVVGVHELLDDVGAEEEAGAAGREAPAFDIWRGARSVSIEYTKTCLCGDDLSLCGDSLGRRRAA